MRGSRGRNSRCTAMARRRYVETTNVVCYGPYAGHPMTSGAVAIATRRQGTVRASPAAPGYWGARPGVIR